NRKGIIVVSKADISEDDIMMYALEAGAEDINSDDDEVFQVITDANSLMSVRDELDKAGVKVLSANIDMIPENEIELDEKQQGNILKMVDKFEELDDVQNVYHNAIITIIEDEEE
ncbi:MAG: YebC/PmpR family DNA-binding transcriptional regulator, partial [Clostridia bacterium]